MNEPKQITINGQVYNLVPEQQETELKNTGWGLPKYNEMFYGIGPYGIISSYIYNSRSEIRRDLNGNAFTDLKVADDVARAQKLQRKLLRFAAERNKVELDWEDLSQQKWSILYSTGTFEFITTSFLRDFGQVYFDSENTAKAALEEFHDELLWYFTKCKTHL